jgi:hypothetical protein
LARRIALALAAGLLVTLFVVWRDADRSDATYVIAAVPKPALVTIELTGIPRRTFLLPRLDNDERGRLLLQIATYLQQPTATVRLAVTDARGRSQARCVFPPSAYHDNSVLTCDVPSLARARRLVVAHAGPAKLAVYGNRFGYTGSLAYTSSGDVISRMRAVVDRVGVSMHPSLGPAVLIGGLWLSSAAVLLALILAFGVARERPDPLLEHREPLGEPAGVLAEPRDDEREVQHDGEEEAERDDEESVGRSDDPEPIGDASEESRPRGEDEDGQPGRQPEH